MTIIKASIFDPAIPGSMKQVTLETADTVSEAIGMMRQGCTVAEQPAPIETQADRANAEHDDDRCESDEPAS